MRHRAYAAWNHDLVTHGKGPAGFPDRMRTSRNHAGEALEDGFNIPGLILWMVGTAALAMTLTAAGYGFAGWMTIGSLVCALGLFGGGAWVLLEHRRIKAEEGLKLRDPMGH